MQQAVSQLWWQFSLLCLGSAVYAAELSINHNTHTINWTDNVSQSWQFDLDTHDWTYNNGTHTWTYNNTTKTWLDDDTDHGWRYDADHNLWVSVDSSGAYTLSTKATVLHDLWRHDASTHQWQPVLRAEAPLLAFSTISGLHWRYNTETEKWEYARTATEERPNIPTAQTWVFAPAALRWEQESPAAGKRWDFNRSNRRWTNIEDTQDWQFLQTSNAASIWEIIDQEPSGPGSWDRAQWRYDLVTVCGGMKKFVMCH